MVIFGSRAKALWAGQEPADVPCDACGLRMLRPLVLQRYFHVFWIPTFALGKKVYFTCGHCRRTVVPKEAPASLAPFAAKARRAARTPLHLFTGLAALAVVVAVATLHGRIKREDEKAWVSAPAVGDFYILDLPTALPEMKRSQFRFVVARVVRVTREAVTVRFGSYGYNLSRRAAKAIEEGETSGSDYFEGEEVALPRALLLGWHADGGLESVIRP